MPSDAQIRIETLDGSSDDIKKIAQALGQLGKDARVAISAVDGQLKKMSASFSEIDPANVEKATQLLQKLGGVTATASKQTSEGSAKVAASYRTRAEAAQIAAKKEEKAQKEAEKAAKDAAKAINKSIRSMIQGFQSAGGVAARFGNVMSNVFMAIQGGVPGVTGLIAGLGVNLAALPFKIVQKGARGLISAFGDMAKMVGALIGYQGIRGIGRALRGVAEEIGPIQSVRTAFANFVDAANQSVDGFSSTTDQMISDLQRATHGAIATTDMLKMSNLAFMLIGDQVATELPALLGVAQAAALSTGQDIEHMFESIVRGVGRLSTRYLDNLGLSISLSEATDQYAEKIGKASDELTHQEQVMGLLQETLRAGQEIILRTGDASLYLSTQANALAATFQNVRDEVLNDLAPVFTVILEAITEMAVQSSSRITDFVQGFVDQLAFLPPTIDSEAARMGARAAEWAANAVVWGANIGINFATGILKGFTNVITFVLNTIAGILTHWFAPGSPPNILPEIDTWGAETIQEWLDGIKRRAEGFTFEPIASELAKSLEDTVEPEFFKIGVDAIESWAEGLSIIDLEFLIRDVESVLDRAKDKQEELTDALGTQRRELFRLQILNKDPAAIRNKVAQVQATEDALEAQEKEVEKLEDRKKLLQDQLKLFRLLLRAVKDLNKEASGGGGGGGGGGGAGAGAIEMPSMPSLDTPLAGTMDLEERIEGLRDRLEEILGQIDFQDFIDQWNTSTEEISEAWGELVDTVTDPEIQEGFRDFVNEVRGQINKDLKPAFGELTDAVGDLAKEIFGLEELPTLPELIIGGDGGQGLIGILSDALRFVGLILDGIKIALTLISSIRGGGPDPSALAEATVQMLEFRESAAALFGDDGGTREAGLKVSFEVDDTFTDVGSSLDKITDGVIRTGDHFEKFRDRGRRALYSLAETAIKTGSDTENSAKGVAKEYTSLKDNIVARASEIQANLKDKFNAAKQAVTLAVTTMVQNGVSKFLEIKKKGEMHFNNLKDAVVTAITMAKSEAKRIFTDIKTAIETILNNLKSSAETIMDNLKKTILDPIQEAWQWFKDHTLDLDISWPSIPPGLSELFDQLFVKSPPKLAVGVSEVNAEMRSLASTIGNMTGSPMTPAPVANNTSTVVFQGPIVQSMVVPNAQTGRAISRQLASDIGEMAYMRRSAA
jgi:hypothetical protein